MMGQQIHQVRKVFRALHEDDGLGSRWSAQAFRPVTPLDLETGNAEPGEPWVRLWVGAVGGTMFFDSKEEMDAWLAEPMEVWVEPIKEGQVGHALLNVHVREPGKMFRDFNDVEMRTLRNVLYESLSYGSATNRRLYEIAERECDRREVVAVA